jgi:Flp pilus assembly protein TadD
LSLGELLRRRTHPGAAKVVLEPAQKLAPFDPLLRHRLATALFSLGESAEAEKLISRMEDVHSEFGPWLSLHGRWLLSQGKIDEAGAAFRAGLELCPLDPEVACEEKIPPETPETPNKAPLCQAARSALQD